MSVDPRSVTDEERLDAAFAATPRPDFLPANVRDHWAEDRPLRLGGGMTNSQPSTVRDMLALLQVPLGASVLDVGSGSGWTTALLAHLVGPQGRVLGVEIEPELVDFGAANVAATHRSWARVRSAIPGVLGSPGDGPFDRILTSAMARRLPQELLNQLAPGGLLVVPVAGRMLRARRDEAGEVHVDRFGAYRFVPLR